MRSSSGRMLPASRCAGALAQQSAGQSFLLGSLVVEAALVAARRPPRSAFGGGRMTRQQSVRGGKFAADYKD